MQFQINFTDEIMVDHFAGGGGTSTGYELATGRPVDIAINHDPDAILMHQTNHPYTQHYCENVWDVDPEKACKGRKIGLMWLSPDCKHFSRAKGGKPVDNKIRGLAWIAVKWARRVRPRVIILENVPEFITWGPLNKHNKPDNKRMGETFKKFVRHIQKLGYKVEWKELKACDYGAPTIRKRFFLVARCDGKPIVFPEATHGEGKIPYRTAAECIDFTIPCKSIFEREKPLAENTMQRIARGLDKFTLKGKKPFIVTCNHSGESFRGQDINKPLNTITQKCTDGLVTPHIVPIGYGERENQKPRVHKITEPLSTVVSTTKQALIAPNLIQYHSEQSRNEVRGQSLDAPIMTIDTAPRYALSTTHIVKYYSGKDNFSDINTPLHTITVKERNALCESHLCVFRNNMDCKTLEEPLPTITTSAGHFAEIRTYITKYDTSVDLWHWPKVRELLNKYCGYNLKEDEILILVIKGDKFFIGDIGMRMLEPRELYRAQGFPEDYIIDRDYKGNIYPRTKQVAKCGNSVPPALAEALIRANLPEWCGVKIISMTQLNSLVAASV